MNYLESIYCFLYQGRLDENQATSEKPTTANIVLSVCFIMIFIGLLIFSMTIFPDLADDLADMFGRNSGKLISRLLIILLLVIIYPVIRLSVGTDGNYKSIIDKYENSNETDKKSIVKKGKNLFFMSLLVLLGSILFNFVVSLF